MCKVIRWTWCHSRDSVQDGGNFLSGLINLSVLLNKATLTVVSELELGDHRSPQHRRRGSCCFSTHLLCCSTCCQTRAETSSVSQRLSSFCLFYFVCVQVIFLPLFGGKPIPTILFSLWLCTGNKSTWFTQALPQSCMWRVYPRSPESNMAAN